MKSSGKNDSTPKLTPLAIDLSSLDPEVAPKLPEDTTPLVVSYREYVKVVDDLFVKRYGGYDCSSSMHVNLRRRLEAALYPVGPIKGSEDRNDSDCAVLVESHVANELRKAGRIADCPN